MAKIELNPSTGRPYGVSVTPSGRFRATITTPERGTIVGPTVDNQLVAKRHAEIIRALLGTGSSDTQIKNVIKGVLN